MTDQTFGKNLRSILLLITAGLVLMLVSTLSYFSANPGLVSHTTTGTQAAAPSGQQMPTSAGMDEATQQGVMALMQKLQKNPTDLEALVGLTEHFMHTQDWQRAETFALRAVVAAPNETQPLYMLGITARTATPKPPPASKRSSPPRKILPYATASASSTPTTSNSRTRASNSSKRRSITRIPLRISRRRCPRKSQKSRNTKTTRLSRRSNVHKNEKAGAPPKGSSGLFVYEGNTG